ncbi:MAG: Na+-transporting NADH:ubiquinone oxidoreductase subunit A, partial [Candidatus Azotimanducaceae bacterium]
VKAGSSLFFDKNNPKIQFCSPVSGEVVEILRGEKRKILEIKVLADKEINYVTFETKKASEATREEIIDSLCAAGLWPFFRQRPFDVIANPEDKPKAIFISAFDSAPLAADNDFILHGMESAFQAGLDVVTKLTEGTTHLNLDGRTNSSSVFTEAKGVQINTIAGPHPAGNVGVQIHHIDAMNKGEVVWTLKPQDVLAIAKLFTKGHFDASRIVALTGSEIIKPRYYRTMLGASIKPMIVDNVTEGNHRYISGNVLTGSNIGAEGTVGFYDTQVTVIPEGTEPEFLGWIAPGLKKFSLSRTFFSWLTPKKEYALNTNMNGEERAFVMTGQYESVFPMDIYPQHMVKAIMMGDVEALESLGVYEVAPEDFALCEFVCTSKIDVQQIVREGLDMVKQEC